jgi:hypothetical protein
MCGTTSSRASCTPWVPLPEPCRPSITTRKPNNIGTMECLSPSAG